MKFTVYQVQGIKRQFLNFGKHRLNIFGENTLLRTSPLFLNSQTFYCFSCAEKNSTTRRTLVHLKQKGNEY